MEKYIRAEMEVVEFDAEDIITTSGGSPVNTASENELPWVLVSQ